MRVLSVHRKGELIGDGLSRKRRAVVQQLLDNLGMALLDAGKREEKRLSATGGVTGDIVQVFDPKSQPRQGAL